MKIAFLTEMGFTGKVPADHPNMRTEFAWMHALDADHHNINNFWIVKDYDVVIVLFPQGNVMVDCHGVELPLRKPDNLHLILNEPIVEILKQNNKKVFHMQEGPTWLFNEYSIENQFNYYKRLSEFDVLLTHNKSDVSWYQGLFPHKPIHTLPTLMIETLTSNDLTDEGSGECIVGGNFSRWYGGFQSFLVAQEFGTSIWTQDSHSKRTNEDIVAGLQHLPRLSWVDWMRTLSKFRFAVHLMPTVAAGTFSLNCAYYGIPCIGNIKMDTQHLCHPKLSVDVDDIASARKLANKLQSDPEFYKECSRESRENYRKHYDIVVWKNKIKHILE